MARYNYEVVYDATVLQNVQSITINKGRVQVQDPFRSSTATITGRNLATLPTVEIGKHLFVTAERNSNLWEVFNGVVSDVQITYGETAAMDTWTIYGEDVLARLGRSVTTDSFSWSAGISTLTALEQVVSNATGGVVSVVSDPLYPGQSYVSAQNLYNVNCLDVANQLAATEQGYLSAVTPIDVRFTTRSQITQNLTNGDFTDGTLASSVSTANYNQVVFRSQADSFYQQVIVEPEGLASQSAGTGARRYTFSSYDQTTTQAANLADYVLATLQVQDSVPSTISCISETQTSDVAVECALDAGTGARVGLILRGNRYEVFVTGATLTADPEQTRFTFNLLSAEALNFFILDSALFGVLDSSRLGF
jgi:hypothetical protein